MTAIRPTIHEVDFCSRIANEASLLIRQNREVPSDVVGRIFQKLIGPDQRHRYGQHFTGDDPVDLINAFCIRAPGNTVLDPACGSGSFLVRAYYRKRQLGPGRPHLDLIGELFGSRLPFIPPIWRP